MNVKVTESGSCRKILEVEIPAEEVSREREGLVEEFRKFVHIPGFRVGRAPKQMIVKKFHQQIEEELQKKLIPQSYREALAKETFDRESAERLARERAAAERESKRVEAVRLAREVGAKFLLQGLNEGVSSEAALAMLVLELLGEVRS